MCMAAGIPLVESGTAGYLGQDRMECFDCIPKPAPKLLPVCTIRSTPSQPIHCIVWAKSYLLPQLFGEDEDGSTELDAAEKQGENAQEIAALRKEALAYKAVRTVLRSQQTTDDAAKTVFEKVFDADMIKNLFFVVKESTKTAAPSSNSKGEVNGHLDGDTIKPPPPLLSNGNGGLKDQRVLSLGDNLALFVSSTNRLAIRVRAGLETIAFDKDDDDTLDFVTAASNLRSATYYIERKTRWQLKEMAGNIPAIATTNAIISGPIVLQALHLLRKSYTSLKNMHLQFKPAVPLSTVNLCSPNPKCGICRDTYSKVQYDPSRVTLSELVNGVLGDATCIRPNHLANAPALILLSSLPKPPFNSRWAITPPAPSRKQTAPKDDTEVVTLAKRAKTNGASSIEPRSPSKKKRLEEDGLVMLYCAMDKMDDNDIIIEID
ncbi:hypothetical protein L210DRAFT_3613153 [Boletus edulis BED1]|uniref:Ubiquitin-activating enzyme SCCH domain-containing protein n=1 Tax=Boletus edulis BED1 TaxID=1328754 RepID=A0AAD4BRW0_BOLED|nr:hypothetical protein L210DRAFT_3613153 [Boletus edulis BED1]